MEERSLKNDLDFGLKSQVEVLETLRKYFDETIEETKEPYCAYDGECPEKNTRYEIKARRCSFSTYPTTIIPYSKRKAAKEDTRLLFVFRFTDGLYYIQYKQELFDTFDTKDVTYYRKGITPRPAKHYCIPTELLLKIEL